jgi:two-component system CheB/CheR fusion protein
MLLAERIGLDDLGRLWMFGTDASHSAIERARRGHYSAQQLATVPRRLRDTYFARGPDGFTVRPALRNRLMFARHDLLRDPPFSRLDLIVCRNTLIYFASTARRRILSAFHYTLRADGLLVLGQDERANVEEAGFELIRPDGQVFRRLEQPQPYNWLDYGCSVVPPQGFPPAAAESRKVARRNEGG